MTAATLRSVEQYLDALRSALRGADPALVQDALYDAEEHLRAEIGAHPGEAEGDVLARIVTSYGAPDEVAEAYRVSEATTQKALRTPIPRPRSSSLGRFFGIYADPRAYLSLLYMLLALVTGIAYFTFAATGLSLSLGLAILITFLRRIGDMLMDPRTWGTLLYLLLMLPLGVFYFMFVVVGLVLSLATTVAPVFVLLYHFGIVQIEGTVNAQYPHPALMPLISILGVLLLTMTLHLARGIGYLHGQLAKTLLVATRAHE